MSASLNEINLFLLGFFLLYVGWSFGKNPFSALLLWSTGFFLTATLLVASILVTLLVVLPVSQSPFGFGPLVAIGVTVPFIGLLFIATTSIWGKRPTEGWNRRRIAMILFFLVYSAYVTITPIKKRIQKSHGSAVNHVGAHP